MREREDGTKRIRERSKEISRKKSDLVRNRHKEGKKYKGNGRNEVLLYIQCSRWSLCLLLFNVEQSRYFVGAIYEQLYFLFVEHPCVDFGQ